MSLPRYNSLPHFFETIVEQYADYTFLLEKTNGSYQGTTYRQVREQVHAFAAGLISLGFEKGDRATMLCEGCNNWVVSELGIFFAGGINVPMSVKLNESHELMYRILHSESKFVMVSSRQAGKIRAIRGQLPLVQKLIVLDGEIENTETEISFAAVLEQGKHYLQTNQSEFENIWKSVQPGDIANICYTSGTTAEPKGIMLSHDNYISNVFQAYSLFEIDHTWRTLLILPWDHAFAHTVGIYCMMGKGASLASVDLGKSPMDVIKNIPLNIKEVKPNMLLSVPALATNFKKNIEKGIRDKGRLTQMLFKHALNVAYRYNGNGQEKGKGLRFLLKPLVSLYDAVLFKKVRASFGGNLKFFVGGGALLDIEFQRFFYAIGIPMLQGYGLTEAAPIISANNLEQHLFGSSGRLVADLELKICDEHGNELPAGYAGEIVVRGRNTMLGYWKNEEATAKSLKHGWLYTGDLGYVVPTGFFYVLGRFKSLLIADDGEKYSPETIEEAFCAESPFIDQCMLHNNQNPYTICLVVPNKEQLLSYLKHKHLNPESKEGHEHALLKIEMEIQKFRENGHHTQKFPQRWLPGSIGILAESFNEQNGLMNSTLKMVRGKITDRYKDRITHMYTSEGKTILNTLNFRDVAELLGSK